MSNIGHDWNRVRLLVVGDSGVGKTSFVQLLCNGKPERQPSWTVGCTVEVKLHDFKAGTPDETPYFIEFWDVGGSYSHEHSRPCFYQPAHGIILVHDLTNRKSCTNLRRWLNDIFLKNNIDDEWSQSPVRKIVTHSESPAQFRRNRSPDNPVPVRPYSSTGTKDSKVPVVVVGTKWDLVERRARGTKAAGGALIATGFPPPSPVALEQNAEEIYLNCNDSKAMGPATTNSLKLTRFFDNVIDRLYSNKQYSSGSGIYKPSSAADWRTKQF